MKKNVLLTLDVNEKLDKIKDISHPGSAPKDFTRSFIINEMIDNFEDNILTLEKLKRTINMENGDETGQKIITFRKNSFDKLQSMSVKVNASVSATLRAMIEMRCKSLDSPLLDDNTDTKNEIKNLFAKIEEDKQKLDEDIYMLKELVNVL